jgi:eukaryotic-like serine/threonine-protein kinase
MPAQFAEALRDRYLLERELGRGGMATVFLAQDPKHDRLVALKVLRPELAATLGPDRFRREVHLAARLQHPHILTVLDSGESAGQLWFTMPYVEGESLRARLTREQQLPLEDALRIAREVALALEYAHEHRVIHRDIKPENILLTKDGSTLVADFGIARAFGGGSDQLTETGMAVGTPAYMSPEQAAGERTLDARADIYSLGIVLYEMLAGEPPYTGATAQAILARRFSEAPRPLRILRDTIPEPIEQAVQKALAKAPADRFSTALQFADALATTAPATAGASGTAPVPPPSRARRWRYVVAAGLATVLAVGLWLVAVRRGARSPPGGAASASLAVLPFSVSAGGSFAYLGEGMVDLLSRSLDGAGDLRAIDAGTVLSAVHRRRLTSPDRATATELAERLGARRFVLGSVQAAGGRLRIQAELYDSAPTAIEPLSRASAEGDTTALFELVDRVARDLLVTQAQGTGFRLAQIAAITTSSLPALKAYLEAEHNLRQVRLDSAIAGFQRATAEDSTFGLAYYRLAVAAQWGNRPAHIDAAADRALALAGRLPPRERALLDAYDAFRRGDASEAERRYRLILRDYPDDLEAGFQLASLLFLYNPLRGRPRDDAREAFTRVAALDPEFLCPI